VGCKFHLAFDFGGSTFGYGPRNPPDLMCVFSFRSGGRVRSHFKHSIERVDDNGEVADKLAAVEDFILAKATYDAAVTRWPKERIMLRQAARIIEDSARR
jgi:hypothetical protein